MESQQDILSSELSWLSHGKPSWWSHWWSVPWIYRLWLANCEEAQIESSAPSTSLDLPVLCSSNAQHKGHDLVCKWMPYLHQLWVPGVPHARHCRLSTTTAPVGLGPIHDSTPPPRRLPPLSTTACSKQPFTQQISVTKSAPMIPPHKTETKITLESPLLLKGSGYVQLQLTSTGWQSNSTPQCFSDRECSRRTMAKSWTATALHNLISRAEISWINDIPHELMPIMCFTLQWGGNQPQKGTLGFDPQPYLKQSQNITSFRWFLVILLESNARQNMRNLLRDPWQRQIISTTMLTSSSKQF